MLIQRLLYFSLKVAEVSLSESGHLFPAALTSYRNRKPVLRCSGTKINLQELAIPRPLSYPGAVNARSEAGTPGIAYRGSLAPGKLIVSIRRGLHGKPHGTDCCEQSFRNEYELHGHRRRFYTNTISGRSVNFSRECRECNTHQADNLLDTHPLYSLYLPIITIQLGAVDSSRPREKR